MFGERSGELRELQDGSLIEFDFVLTPVAPWTHCATFPRTNWQAFYKNQLRSGISPALWTNWLEKENLASVQMSASCMRKYYCGPFDLTLNGAGLPGDCIETRTRSPQSRTSTNIKAFLVLSQQQYQCERWSVVFIDVFDLRKLKACSRDWVTTVPDGEFSLLRLSPVMHSLAGLTFLRFHLQTDIKSKDI